MPPARLGIVPVGGRPKVTLGAAIDYSRLPTIGRRGIPALSVIAAVRPGITQWGRTRPVRGHARRPFGVARDSLPTGFAPAVREPTPRAPRKRPVLHWPGRGGRGGQPTYHGFAS